MNGINLVMISGRLGKDAATRFTPSGTAVTNFSVACDRGVKSDDGWKTETEWVNVVAWKKENLANYLTKGREVTITGRLQTRKWDKDGETRYSTEVVADQIVLHGGGKGEQSAPKKPSENLGVSQDDFDVF